MFAKRLLPLALLALVSLWSCQEASTLVDFDGDGSLDADHCQPANPAVYPGAADGYGDDIDQNCDGGDGIDFDGDGYPGNDDLADPSVYDCDDNDANNFPTNTEVCDLQDNDCDGLVDDLDPDVSGQPTWYQDSDGDAFGDAAQTLEIIQEHIE